jgi:hypothetical protein
MAILSLLMNTEQLAQDLRAGGVPVMLKAAGCPRVATAMLVAIALICQGCSFGGHRSSGTTIRPEGGHAATAFASVDAPAGAVTKLTKLHLTKGGADPLGGFSPDAGSMLDTPSGSIQVDLSGAQPQKPLTLSVPVPAGMDGTKAVLLTTHDGKPEALPTTPGAAGWVQASVSHLSPFRIAFLNFDKVGAFFRDAALFLGSAVGAAGTAQACANQPLQLAGGGTLSITGPTSPISVCLTSDSGGMHVSAQSADALPWRVRISKGTYDGAAEVSTSNVALQTAYNQLVKDRRFSEGLLAPQGKGSWHLTDDVADVTMQASVSTGMWLTSAVIFSAVYLFQVFTGAATKGVTGAAAAVKTVIDRGGYLDCFSSAVGAVPEGKILTAQQIGKLTKAGIDCAGPLIEQMGGVVSGLAAVVLTALGAGVAVVVSGFEGAFRTIKEPILTWHITTTGRPAPSTMAPDATLPEFAGPPAPSPTLGVVWASNQQGYGTERPATIFNGGDPTGEVRNIIWSSWGGSQAIGQGIGWYVGPSGPVSMGHDEPATVVAYDLGNCNGHPGYRGVDWYFPQHGETFEPRHYYDICTPRR